MSTSIYHAEFFPPALLVEEGQQADLKCWIRPTKLVGAQTVVAMDHAVPNKLSIPEDLVERVLLVSLSVGGIEQFEKHGLPTAADRYSSTLAGTPDELTFELDPVRSDSPVVLRVLLLRGGAAVRARASLECAVHWSGGAP